MSERYEYTAEGCVGPNAFFWLDLLNQGVWDRNPDRAKGKALDAIASGGFDRDCISRKVGNYEGQIMAIRNGWVDGKPYRFRKGWDADVIDVWAINDKGRAALIEAGRSPPVLLPVRDDWHSRKDEEKTFQYCAYELERNGHPALRLFEKAIPCGASWGMDPILRREDVVALRDYLNDWLART